MSGANVTPTSDDPRAIGDLTLAETSLGDLLREVLEVLSVTRRGRTTGQHAEALKRFAERDESGLFPGEFVPWLDRVLLALEARNDIVHASARLRCRWCGQGTAFVKDGRDVDRSPETVHLLTRAIDGLAVEGEMLAGKIAERINARREALAKRTVSETGEYVGVDLVRFRGGWAECVDCGDPQVMSAAMASSEVLVVLPKEQMRELREALAKRNVQSGDPELN